MGKIGRRKDPLREKSLQITVKIAESLRRRQCVGGWSWSVEEGKILVIRMGERRKAREGTESKA